MKILAFDASGPTASVALCEDDRLMASSYSDAGLTHSQTLLPMIEELLRRTGWSIAALDLLAVTRGPGSFTGLRIGLSTAQGLAFAHGTPCCGVSSLLAAAYGAAFAGGRVCALMDARRSQFYTAQFRADGSEWARLTPDQALAGEDIAQSLGDADVWLAGNGAALWHRQWGTPRTRLLPAPLLHPQAWSVAMIARAEMLAGGVCDAAALTPAYLRLPQAEREQA